MPISLSKSILKTYSRVCKFCENKNDCDQAQSKKCMSMKFVIFKPINIRIVEANFLLRAATIYTVNTELSLGFYFVAKFRENKNIAK